MNSETKKELYAMPVRQVLAILASHADDSSSISARRARRQRQLAKGPSTAKYTGTATVRRA
jgi:hypothetical protein